MKVTVTPAARLLHALADADAARCEEMVREMTVNGAPVDPLKLEAVFARWMELAKPLDILAVVKASGIEDRRWTSPFFEAWAAGDYAGAMAGSVGAGDFSGIRALVAMRHSDPAFLDESFDVDDVDKSLTADALAALGRNDPELAKGVATRHGSKPDQNVNLIAAIVRGWAERDPAAAFEWVNSLELDEGNRIEVLNPLLFSWMKSDPAAAAKAAIELKYSTGGLDSDKALSLLRAPDSPLAQAWLMNRADPFANVGDFYRRLSESPIDWDTAQIPMRAIDTNGWFATDPARAAAEAAELPPGKARDFLLATICAQWADRSPAEAVAFAEKHGLKPPRVRIDPPASQLGADPAATLAPFFAGAGDRERLRVLEEKWSQADPRAAAEWLMGQPESVSFDRATDGESRTLLDNALGYYWARIDANGATEWVASLPNGPRRDTAWQAMKYFVGEYSPDLVFTVSAQLVGGERRMQTLETDLKAVARKIGVPAAREILEIVYLNDAESAELAEFLENLKPAAK